MGIRPKKSPKIHNRPVKIRDNGCAKKLAHGQSGRFAGEYEDF